MAAGCHSERAEGEIVIPSEPKASRGIAIVRRMIFSGIIESSKADADGADSADGADWPGHACEAHLRNLRNQRHLRLLLE